jgi:hypothetical protein
MDDGPFAQAMDRIRLIGRLFFLIRLEGQFPREYGSLIVSSTLQTYKDFYELCGAFCGAAGENVGACAYQVCSSILRKKARLFMAGLMALQLQVNRSSVVLFVLTPHRKAAKCPSE